MPQRKHTPDFTACTQFGLRYSTLGKRIAASEPYHDGESPREVTSTMNLYELCEALDIELTEEQAEKEAEYIYENRRQFYKNHPYMEKKAIAQCYDGPVFPDDVVYRRSNCEKYTVLPDGSIVNTSGTVEVKQPNWEGFVHTAPKKHEKVATFTKGMPRKTNDKSPAITLPKQANPLVKGEYKTRTPEEASRSAAKQREQARKKGCCCDGPKITDFSPLDEMVVDKCLGYHKDKPFLTPMEVAEQMATEAEKNIVREHYQGVEEEAKREVANFLQRRFIHFCEEVAAGRGEAPEICEFRKYASKEILAYIPHDMLIHELRRRGKDTPSGQLLQAYLDKELADEIRRRGYTVNATKTVEI